MADLSSTSEDRLARLRASLSDDPKVSRAANRMQRNRPANVLAGVALHAAARQEQGLELSDLEQGLVDVMREFVDDQEVAACGLAWRQASVSTAAGLFPESVTRLTTDSAYSYRDLAADLPALAAEILAQPNVNIVDVAGLGPEGAVDDAGAVEAMAEYGGTAVTVLTAPAQGGDAMSRLVSVDLRAVKFQCVRATDDTVFGPKDEIYWVSAGSGDIGYKRTYRSPEFGAIQTGDTRNFASGTSMFLGAYQQTLMINIECWEKDSGAIYQELQNHLWKIADKCADAAKSIMENGESSEAALAAIIAVVAALLVWLLGWLSNDDDLVGERSIAITSNAARYLISGAPEPQPAGNADGDSRQAPSSAQPGPQAALTYDFSSSVGHYRLHTQTVPAPDPNIYTVNYHNATGWSPETYVPIPRETAGALSAGVVDGKLHLLHRDPGPGATTMQGWTLDGTFWGGPTQLPVNILGEMSNLVTMGGKMYGLYTHNNGEGYQRLLINDGTGWSTKTIDRWPSYLGTSPQTYLPKTLAVLDDTLYAVARNKTTGYEYGSLHMRSYTNGFSSPSLVNIPSGIGSAALEGYGSRLVLVHTDQQRKVCWATYDGTAWTSHGQIHGATSSASPALITHFNMLHCVVKGSGTRDLYWNKFNGIAWTPWEKVPQALAGDTPALAHYRNTTRLFYRR
ncbi:hypothetical protein [Streptomyces xanthochromogenes]|uniref:hypothetical protein n=1 Tax=Streptomyces xanthochromogenes TaxID=67384 RepID=UPI00344059DC